MIYIKLLLILITLLITSYVFGSFFNYIFFKENKLPKVTFGFYSILAIYQLFIWYPLLKLFNNKYIDYGLYLIIIIFIFTFGFMIFKRKEYLKIQKKDFVFYLLIILITYILINIFVYVKDDAADNMFYIGNMVEHLADDPLLKYNPFNGISMYMSKTYAYQSFYLFVDSFARNLNINPLLIVNWILPIIVLTINFETIKFLIKDKNKLIIIGCLFLIFSYSNIVYPSNGALYKVALFGIILYLLDNLKDTIDALSQLKYATVLSGLFVAGISLHSTFLFQGLFMLIACGFTYTIMKKDHNVIVLAAPLTVLIIYYTFFIGNPLLIKIYMKYYVLLFVIYFLIRFNKKILQYLHYFIFSGFTLGVLGLSVYLMTGKTIYSEAYLFGASNFFNNLCPEFDTIQFYTYSILYILVIIGIIYMFIKTRKSNNFVFTYGFMVMIIFFNPISIYFVSTFLTKDVYFRIDEIFIKNIYLVVLLINGLSVYKGVLYLISIVSLINSLSGFMINKEVFESSFDRLYRMEDDVIEIMQTLDVEAKKTRIDKTWKYYAMSTDLRVRYFTNELAFLYDGKDAREIYDDIFTNDKLLYYYLTKANNGDDMSIISRIMNDYKIKYVVMDNKQIESVYNELEKYCKVIKQNDTYRLYECNYSGDIWKEIMQ